MSAGQTSIARATGPLLEFAFRLRVPLTWIVAIGGLLLARPTAASIALGAVWAAVGLGWRAWAAGTIHKNTEVATGGPYALSRHPLYFGNLMLACGFAAASARLLVFVGVMLLAIVIYLPLIAREEAAMLQAFGDRYAQYMHAVPRLIPMPRRTGDNSGFSWRQYAANREYNAAIGYCAAVAALVALRLVHLR